MSVGTELAQGLGHGGRERRRPFLPGVHERDFEAQLHPYVESRLLGRFAAEVGSATEKQVREQGARMVRESLAQHRQVDLLTFTGSSQTGKRLLIAAGESNMKRLILECGGKAPNIVFDDCPDGSGRSFRHGAGREDDGEKVLARESRSDLLRTAGS